MKYRILIVNGRGCAALHVWAARNPEGDLLAVAKKTDAQPFDDFDAADAWRADLITRLPFTASVEVVADRT